MMGKVKLRPWNSAEHLKTEADIALYLEACKEKDDPALIEHAQGIVACARRVMQAGNDALQADEG